MLVHGPQSRARWEKHLELLDGPHSDVDLVASLDDKHIQIGELQRDALALIAEVDRSGLWKSSGNRDCAQWVCARYGYNRFRAKRFVAAAHALKSLPKIADALSSGLLDLDRVMELTRMATAEAEERLIPWARRVTVSWIRHQADLSDLKAARHAKRQANQRHLDWFWDEDSMLSISGRLTTDQGAAFLQGIQRVVDSLPKDDPTSQDPIASRRADALVALASARIATDADPDRATVVVHTTFEALASKHLGSELQGGIAITPNATRRLCCDSRVEMVVYGPDGNVIDVGTTTYTVPRWLRRQVLRRDRNRCTHPGCHMARFVDVHHIEPWPKGPTVPRNLVTVCRLHHLLLHEFAWKVTVTGDTVTWYRPNGDVYDPKPLATAAAGGPSP